MKREFKVEANVGAPRSPTARPITKVRELTYVHKKQTGGSGQYAKISLRFEPRSRARAMSSRARSSAARCPRNSSGRVKGLNSARESGVLAGFR